MDWISWSRTWATRRTTTTSRKPLRCSSKILRWKRMYLLLRAVQRLKQNQKKRTLASSSTKTVLIEKESGPLLSQKIIRQSLTQCQKKIEYFSSSRSSTSRRWWSDCASLLVEVLCTTPHIYEQKTAQTMATSWTCLSTTSTLACTWSRTSLRPEHLSTDH